MRLSDIIKNEKTLLSLENTLSTGKLPHAVVLESSDKDLAFRCAKHLASYAVCMNDSPEKRPCMVCAGCLKSIEGNHPDIYTAQTAGKTESINVAEIKKICSDAYVIPNEARTKVYLLYDGDNMLIPAQNAFLKVLEEPPQSILFLITCTQSGGLLETIRSRATIYNLDSSASVFSEYSVKLSEDIALSVCESTEYNLLKQTSLLKNKKESAEVLKHLEIIIKDACVLKSGGKNIVNSRSSEELSRSISMKNLFKMLEQVQQGLYKIERNTNMNIFAVWLCQALRQCKYD